MAGLGAALVGLGQFAEALPLLERALAIGPVAVANRADALAALGRALCETGRDPVRGRALASQAVAAYTTLGGAEAQRGHAVEAWLPRRCRAAASR
jgi:tetratricopeptide (TPR) repeat protein